MELSLIFGLKSCSPQRECGFNSRLGHGLQPIRNDRLFYYYNIATTIRRCCVRAFQGRSRLIVDYRG